VHFVGRLATYKYYNMDQVTAQALATFDKIQGMKQERVVVATQAAKPGLDSVAVPLPSLGNAVPPVAAVAAALSTTGPRNNGTMKASTRTLDGDS
jgi:hypothetical protein